MPYSKFDRKQKKFFFNSLIPFFSGNVPVD
jgi:hypothetical protein